MNDEFRNYRKRVFSSILYSFVIATLVYALIIFLTDVIFKDVIANSLYNMNYKIYYLIVTNKYIIFIIIFVLTIFISIFYSLNKTIKSMSVIINSIDKVFKKDENLIELPSEFKEVQNKLNSIKYDMMKNEQLAKEAEQRKNDLVVYLAHDLKTPLTSIIGYLNLLNEADDIKKETFKKYISILVDKSNRLETLINEFFEITRFNMQNLTLTKSKINLKIMINQLVNEFYPMLSEKGLEFSVNINEDIYINVDADKLARVFDNILRNAINYSYEKSIIEVNVTKDTELIQISFKNSGKTIPQNEIANIFEKFYRLDSARNSYTGGAGLGLAIAKEIVELHGGKISAISKDEITQFNVTLPL
jgi:two-component system sensor histidine kinase VanS